MRSVFANGLNPFTKQTWGTFCGLFILSMAFFVSVGSSADKSIFEDQDGDRLTNEEEALYGTKPDERDTDGDGYSDGVEVESGYDPLKPAPGDKLVTGIAAPNDAPVDGMGGDNMTELLSNEIASILMSQNDTEDGGVTMDELNQSVEDLLTSQTEEIVLPEISEDDIRIKELATESLSDEQKQSVYKKATLEYLTVMAYIFANNSPKEFSTEEELKEIAMSSVEQGTMAIGSGNFAVIDEFAESGEAMLKELEAVEVPENMVDVHIKGLQLAQMAVVLKGELKSESGEDPLGQADALAKILALGTMTEQLLTEVETMFSDYGIEEIPLDL